MIVHGYSLEQVSGTIYDAVVSTRMWPEHKIQFSNGENLLEKYRTTDELSYLTNTIGVLEEILCGNHSDCLIDFKEPIFSEIEASEDGFLATTVVRWRICDLGKLRGILTYARANIPRTGIAYEHLPQDVKERMKPTVLVSRRREFESQCSYSDPERFFVKGELVYATVDFVTNIINEMDNL